MLGLATGSSPLCVYRELATRHRDGGLSVARARAFLLDEYVGLPAGHPQSYRAFIERELVRHLDFAPGAVTGPDSHSADLPAACRRFEEAIAAAGGIDLQVLGIGADGHIGFNEPGSSLASRTRIKTLMESTRRDNARFFGSLDEVPHHVVTQGIGTILEARHLVLLAFGEPKAAAVALGGRGTGDGDGPGHGAAAAPARHRRRRRASPPQGSGWPATTARRGASKPAWQGL